MAEFVDEIVSGRLAPGDALPREIAVAERFGISRGVARECLRGLEERGLATVRHGSATLVNPRENWDVLDEIVIAATLGGPTASESIDGYLDTRRVAEVHAVGLAAAHATADDLAVLGIQLSEMREVIARRDRRGQERDYARIYAAFHTTVAAMSNNVPLAAVIRRIVGALVQTGFPMGSPSYRRTRALPEHAAIVEALSEHDAKAAVETTRIQLDSIEKDLRQHARRVARSA